MSIVSIILLPTAIVALAALIVDIVLVINASMGKVNLRPGFLTGLPIEVAVITAFIVSLTGVN